MTINKNNPHPALGRKKPTKVPVYPLSPPGGDFLLKGLAYA